MFKLFSKKKKSGKKQGRQSATEKKKKDAKVPPKTEMYPKKRSKRGTAGTPNRRGAFDALFLYDLMQMECEREIDPSAAVFLEGVLNYIGTEILELCYNRAKERSKAKFCLIVPEDILEAVENDEELKYMIKFKKSSRLQMKKEASNVQDYTDMDIVGI